MYKGAAADESCAWYTVAPAMNKYLSHLRELLTTRRYARGDYSVFRGSARFHIGG
jgi:hypothetical protein